MMYIKITTIEYSFEDYESVEIVEKPYTTIAEFNEYYYGYLLNEYANQCIVTAKPYVDADCTIPFDGFHERISNMPDYDDNFELPF